MTSRERIDTAFKHREPDRTPMYEYVLLNPIASKLLGRRYADYRGYSDEWTELVCEKGWEESIRQYVTDRLDLAQLLGHDMLYVTPNPMPGSSIESASESERQSASDPVESVRQRNEEAQRSFAKPPEQIFLVYIYLKAEMQKRGMDLPILAPAYAHGVWTDVDLMQTMLLAPEVAHNHFTHATRSALQYVEAYIQLGVDQIGVGGDFAGNRPLISPDVYRRFIMPEVRAVSRRIHESGLWAINASDGNLWSVINDFLIGCEVDGYLEIDMNAGMDLHRLKQEYGDKTVLYGNMDCGSIMSFGSVDDVRSRTRECLEAGTGNGGHIFCCSNAITASVPLNNYIAMVATYHEIFGLPDPG